MSDQTRGPESFVSRRHFPLPEEFVPFEREEDGDAVLPAREPRGEAEDVAAGARREVVNAYVARGLTRKAFEVFGQGVRPLLGAVGAECADAAALLGEVDVVVERGRGRHAQDGAPLGAPARGERERRGEEDDEEC